ncbi:MAG: hypothetical protein K9L30_10915 [Desulfobacterales bacterium]|nr:hypothetical protein [Desulfobacterales bacterium]
MAENKKNGWTINISLPKTTSSALRGKQSVRATFKLPERTIDAISIVATHLGIKQKSLFDHLLEDIQTLDTIARKVREAKQEIKSRRQKTFVMSRNTLSSIEKISRDFGIPRDTLVDYSIQRLMPIIEREREKHKKRKAIAKELINHFKEGEKILKKTKKLLGDDDPVSIELQNAMIACVNSYRNIDAYIERGNIIEGF